MMESSWPISNPKRRCCESAALNMPAAVATGLEKVSFHSNPKERQCQRMLKLPYNALISHTSKVMLKILQARLQQHVNWELSDVQSGFRKGRRARDQIANICRIIEKARVPPKYQLLLYWLCQSLWLCGSQQTGKFLELGIPEKPVSRLRNNS